MVFNRFAQAIVRYAGAMDPRTLHKYMRGDFPEPFNRLLRDREVVAALLADLEADVATSELVEAAESENTAA